MAKNSITVDVNDLSTVAKQAVDELAATPLKKSGFRFAPADVELEKAESERASSQSSLVKSVLNLLDGPKGSIERLAFETDPSLNNSYAGLYKAKMKLMPDEVLKRIAIQDDLVAAIVQARQNHISSFGKPREDRFSKGFAIEVKKGVLDRPDMTEEKKKALQDRIDRAVKLINHCGNTEGWDQADKTTFSQWLSMSVRNAIVVGRIATEIIWTEGLDGEKKFHSFRVVDAGTIYRAVPQKSGLDRIREQARHLLEQLKNERLQPERYMNDEYQWVQVIHGRPVQAFTESELVVQNFYPVPDVELDGYPVTPIDTMIAAVTTHINITNHNKVYFQSGRAARGMLVVKSDEVDESVIGRIKQQFNASINGVANAWRMPVFGVGAEDELSWQPIDTGGRDMEFQYLSDMNARIILSAFSISPDELPGWSYLSRGTNNQALSESNEEYKLTAARDVGIRPIISHFEDFVNSKILPLIDEKVAELCHFKMLGLDAETAEKESVRIQQDQQIHMTINEVLERVEKDPLPKELAGEMLLNPVWQAQIDKYVPVGVIREHLLGIKGAAKDPAFQYIRDPFWFQWQQLQMQMQQMQMQQQMAQQQQQMAAQGGGGGPEGGPPPDQGGGGPPPSQDAQQGNSPPSREESPRYDQPQPTEKQRNEAMGKSDLAVSIEQALGLLSKGEAQLPPSRQRLLAQHKATLDHFLKGMEADRDEVMKEILEEVEAHVPAPKKE